MVERSVLFWEKLPPPGQPAKEVRLLFFADDREGIPLEVFGVETQYRRLVIIHAMLLRPRFRPMYEEDKRCQD